MFVLRKTLAGSALAVFACFCVTGAAAQKTTGTVAEMVESAAERQDPLKNQFLSDGRVVAFRQIAEETKDPGVAIQMRFKLAWELLRAGSTREAIAEFQRLLGQVQDSPQFDRDQERRVLRMLAISHLRLGEQENCLFNHNAASCLLPISGAGIHIRQQGSRAAIELLEILLEEKNEPELLWLLNLAYMTVGEYPDETPERWRISPDAFASESEIQPFEDVAGFLGVDHDALSGGVVVDDMNGDGYLDILSSSWGLRDSVRFYVNNADGTFSDKTIEVGLGDQRGGLNMVSADYDSDGDLDVLIMRGAWLGVFGLDQGDHPNSLLRNDGGVFRDVTIESGLLAFEPSQAGAWADFDLDGHLDLFIGNESSLDPDNPQIINAYRCRLFRNQGNGTFTDVAVEVGLDHIGFVKGATWGDYDNDGLPDLYLSHLGQPNKLFHNDGLGRDGLWTFTDVSDQAGVQEPLLSFPTWFWDYDNDGWQDLLAVTFMSFTQESLVPVVLDYLGVEKAATSRLYRNNRDGTFEDVTEAARLDQVLLAMGANFGDLDNDGFLDAYFGTGQPSLATLVPNRMFRNDSGRVFQDVTTAGGFGHVQKGHGITFADIDNDGDQDIYAVMGGAYSGDIYRNALFLNPGGAGNWITLELEGAEGTNRSAVGARVRLVLDDSENGREVYRTREWGSSFGNTPRRMEIGVGKTQTIRLIEIRWPDQARSVDRFENVTVNQRLRVVQGTGRFETVELRTLDLRGSGGGEHHGHH